MIHKSTIINCKLYDINSICFEGGGIRSIAYLGAIKCLEDFNILQNIKNFIGSSSGALTATILSVGYTFDELFDITYNKNFSEFIQVNSLIGIVKNLIKLYKYSGYYCNFNIRTYVEQLINTKLGCKDITFKQLYDKTGNNLIITGTCIEKQCTEYFSKDTTPDMIVSLALQISTCIPFFYIPVKYNDYTYIDGGILDNFPISYLENNYDIYDYNIIGLKFNRIIQPPTLNNVKNFSISFINILLDNTEKCQNYNDDKYKIITIDVEDIKTTEFNLSIIKKNKLLLSGYESTCKFLNLENIDYILSLFYTNYLQPNDEIKQEINIFVKNILNNFINEMKKEEDKEYIKLFVNNVITNVINKNNNNKIKRQQCIIS